MTDRPPWRLLGVVTAVFVAVLVAVLVKESDQPGDTEDTARNAPPARTTETRRTTGTAPAAPARAGARPAVRSSARPARRGTGLVRVRVTVTSGQGRAERLVVRAAGLRSAGRYVAGSCRVITRAAGRRTCGRSDPVSGLRFPGLDRGAALSIAYRVRLHTPACRPAAATIRHVVSSRGAPSADESTPVDAGAGRSGVPACDSPAGSVRRAVPAGMLDRCVPAGRGVGRPAAQVRSRPRSGADVAQYEVFAARNRVRGLLDDRIATVGAAKRRTCGRARTGIGTYGTGGSGGRFVCWVDNVGRAWVEWTRPSDGLYAYATRRDGSVARLHRWWARRGRGVDTSR